MECLGYSYLDNPVRKTRKPRTVKAPVFAPLDPPASVAGPSQPSAHNLSAPIHTPYHSPYPTLDAVLPSSLEIGLAAPTGSTSAYLDTVTPSAPSGLPGIDHHLSSVPHGPGSATSMWWDGGSGPIGSHSGPFYRGGDRYVATPLTRDSVSLLGSSSSDDRRSGLIEYGPSDFSSLGASIISLPTSSHGSMGTSNVEQDDDSSVASEDSETEAVMSLVTPALPLDRNARGNALPFVLSSYLRWMSQTMFEPLVVAHWMRDLLIQRYNMSDDSRRGALLVATVLESIDKDPGLSLEQFPPLMAFRNRVNLKLRASESGQESSYDTNMAALEDLQELVLVQSRLAPISYMIRVFGDIARVYRRVCSYSTGEPVRLLSQLLHPNSILRHFPAMDLYLALCVGRSTYLQYDTTPIPGLSNDPLELNNIGLQRVHGLPDQFLVMLARMNNLRDDFGPNVDPQIVQELETEIENFQPVLDESPDPHLRIARMAVHELWRLVMYIYLYMGVCGVSNEDIRVEGVMKKFTKLIFRIKPGRRPDYFMLGQMIVAGMAARKERDRFIIEQRMLSVRECARPGTGANDSLKMLLEVWRMSDSQGRPTVWSDLGTACSIVAGDI
ncbi:Fungal specific transcription factor domain [Ceratobasidium sp. AG-Ba]|nr:Fungal specific transcription factor domain [Ceratobasidium sp. AG-Ba]QRW07179.1 Fungal specific transcription factor domain [Ceratobasidium sp. AG-Ba]